MADPLVLILLVAAAESTDPMTRGIAAAARNALGWDGRVLVRGSAGPPTDPLAIDAETKEHADAVVELRWPKNHHREASLRMHVASTNSWVDRRIVFRRADADAERQRTLAFAMVSILPEPIGSGNTAAKDTDSAGSTAAKDADGGATSEGKPTNEPNEPNEGTEAEADGGPVEPDAASANPPDASPLPGPAPEAAAQDRIQPASPTEPATMGLEVFVVDAAGDPGGAPEIGGAGSFGWFVWRNVSVRVGGSVRNAELDQASGDVLKLTGSAGLALHPWRATPAHPFGASIRVDYLLLYEQLSPVTPRGENVPSRESVLSGCDGMVDGSWLFAPSVEIVVGAGVEVFPPTTIQQGRTTLASLPIARGLFEGGLRLRF